MTENVYEKELIDAGERLGKALGQASDEEKKILRDMKAQVSLFADEEEKKGKYLDRSALFAAGIIAHPDITNSELVESAKEYIDKDYTFVKSFTEK